MNTFETSQNKNSNSSTTSEKEKSSRSVSKDKKNEENSKQEAITTASKSSSKAKQGSTSQSVSSGELENKKSSSSGSSSEEKNSSHSHEDNGKKKSEASEGKKNSEASEGKKKSEASEGKKKSEETNGKAEEKSNREDRKDKEREKKGDRVQSDSYLNPIHENRRDTKPVRLLSEATLNSKMFLTWKSITYEVAQKSGNRFNCCKSEELKYKQILKGITGQVGPGDLLAIMGPSGAGKTTFLNILARRIKSSPNKKVLGSIELNGEYATRTEFKKISGFVSQEDILMGSMTPYEALMFTAKLTLGNQISEKEKEDKVLDLLSTMGLLHVKDNYIGYVGASSVRSGIARGVSGGERKRVSICVELMHNPLLIFMDEPTSGLDSYAAKAVMGSLRSIADQGRTIVCTIHQPAVDIFRMFNKLLLLGSGNIVYFGPTSDAVDYFQSIGHPVPKFCNPADHYLTVVQMGGKEAVDVEDGANLKDAVQDHTVLAELFKKSKYGELVNSLLDKGNENSVELEREKHGSSCCGGAEAETQTGNQHAPVYVQVIELYKRSRNNIFREPLLFKTRMFQTLFMAILAGLIFLQLPNTLTGADNKVSGGFFVAINPLFGALSAPIASFPPERAVYWRENGGGLYSAAAYFFSKLAAEVPVNLFAPIIFSTITWWMIGFQNEAGAFFTFVLMQIILSAMGYGLGMVITMSIYDPGVAQRVQPLVLLPLMLFAGFFINSNSIPVWLIWLDVLSPLKYAFRATMNVILGGLTITCGPDDFRQLSFGLASLNTTADPWISSIANSTNSVLVCPTTSGDQILQQYGFYGYNVWIDILIVVCFTVFFYIVSFVLLAFRKARF